MDTERVVNRVCPPFPLVAGVVMLNLTRFSFIVAFAALPAFAQSDCDCNTGVAYRPSFASASAPAYAPRYAANFASAPMMSAGAIGCVPMAATQCVTVPIQCAPVTVAQPRYEERTVERTVMVPKLVDEKRKVREVRYKNVQKEREVTVYETRPRVRTVQRKREVFEPAIKQRTENYTVMKPVVEERQREVLVSVPERIRKTAYRTELRPEYRNAIEEYTVMVPHRVRRTATRTETRSVPVTRTQTVNQDAGYWATQQVPVQRPITQMVAATSVGAASGIGGCCPCVPVSCGCQTEYMTRQVYVPQTVQRQQQYTAYQQQTVEVPYDYEQVTMVPTRRQRTVRQTRMRQVKVPYEYTEVVYRDKKEYRTEKVERMVAERRQRTIEYTAMVPKTKIENVRVTEYESVPVKRRETYTASVPEEIEREVTVQVYRDTPRRVTETVRVPVTGGTIIR